MTRRTQKGDAGEVAESIDWETLLQDDDIDFIVSEDQMQQILKLLETEIDDEGFIIDKDGERILSIDSSEIQPREIGAILPGSIVYLKKNIASFSQYLFERKKM
jgi:hypothetical protein